MRDKRRADSARPTGTAVVSAFRPPAGLANPHLQSLLGGFPALRLPVMTRERWELADGDFFDLDWMRTSGTRWVLVLPGLGGGIRSAYALRLLRRLHAGGYRAGLLHYRGGSGTPNRQARGYHGGFTRDLDLVAHRLADSHGPGYVIGYSMGGNLLLKWLGELGSRAPVRAAASVSVPFELAPVALSLESGPARPYERFLLGGLRRQVRRKHSLLPPAVAAVKLRNLRSIREFDEMVTAPLHGFTGACDYYARTSCRPWLRRIRVPTLILHALDDPFVPRHSVPAASELAPAVTLELSRHGGHVGFLGSTGRFARFWLEERLAAWFEAFRE